TAEAAPGPVAEAPAPAAPDLSAEVRARIERARAPRPTAAEAIFAALRAPLSQPEAQAMAAMHTEVFGAQAVAAPPRLTAAEPEPVVASALAAPVAQVTSAPVTAQVASPVTAQVAAPVTAQVAVPVAHGNAPATEVEVQTPPTPAEELAPEAR